MNEATYYQRNRNVILNRAKDYQKNDIERSRGARENIEVYLKKKKKIKRENMEEIDIIICQKNKN